MKVDSYSSEWVQHTLEWSVPECEHWPHDKFWDVAHIGFLLGYTEVGWSLALCWFIAHVIQSPVCKHGITSSSIVRTSGTSRPLWVTMPKFTVLKNLKYILGRLCLFFWYHPSDSYLSYRLDWTILIYIGCVTDQLIKMPQVYYYLISNYENPVVLADMVWWVSSTLSRTSRASSFQLGVFSYVHMYNKIIQTFVDY